MLLKKIKNEKIRYSVSNDIYHFFCGRENTEVYDQLIPVCILSLKKKKISE